jgi:hypothetical protein
VFHRLVGDAVVGFLGVFLAVALLVASERIFARQHGDSDLVGALLLLAAAGQATPSLGLVLTVHRLLLRATRVEHPDAHPKDARSPAPPQGQNLVLVALFAFAVSFCGVFALVHSTVFVPLIVLLVVGWYLYVPLVREAPTARVIWRVLSISALAFGIVGLATLARL